MLTNSAHIITCISTTHKNKKLISRANMNFFTMTSSTTFTQRAPEATEFGEIAQHKGHYAVQGHGFSYQSIAHVRLPISD